MEAAAVRLALVVGLMMMVGLSSALIGDVDGPGVQTYTVDELLAEYPLGEQVRVKGEVIRMKETGPSGNSTAYQRFMVGGGEEELLVVCAVHDDRLELAAGDGVAVAGTFKEYRGTLEVYTQCGSVERNS